MVLKMWSIELSAGKVQLKMANFQTLRDIVTSTTGVNHRSDELDVNNVGEVTRLEEREHTLLKGFSSQFMSRKRTKIEIYE